MVPTQLTEERNALVLKKFKNGLTSAEESRLKTVRKLMDMQDYVDGLWCFDDLEMVNAMAERGTQFGRAVMLELADSIDGDEIRKEVEIISDYMAKTKAFYASRKRFRILGGIHV